MKSKDVAVIFKALCDEKRLNIIELLKTGEKCACDIADIINIKQNALSYHMKILVESKIVNAQQDGKWMRYNLDEKGIERAKEVLSKITTTNIIK